MSAEPDFDLLRQGFVPEMRDLLEKAAAALLDLEADPGNAPAVNELFRVVHTIKGTAGMFELPLLVELVHAAEDLLGAVRDGKVTLSAWIADDMLGMFDRILLWVDEIDAHGCLPVGSGDFVRDRAARYRAYLAGQGPVAVVPPTAPPAPEAEPEAPPTARTVLPAWVDAALAAELAPKLSGAGLLIRHTPHDNCFFTGDDPLFTMGQVPGRLWMRVLPAQPLGALRKLRPLTSAVGEGTRVALKLPLTMAVTRVMTVEVAGQLYGVPMDQVAETVRIPRDRIRRIKHSEAFMLREALVPIVRLRAKLALPRRDHDEEATLVVRIAGAPIGLLIDAFHAGMEVILKPLTGILQNAPGYAETAVLGDGKVLLVLNLKELI